VTFLTPELLAEKPALDIHKAMFKDLVAVQKKVGTRDAFFVTVQGYPLKGGKRTSLVIVAHTRDAVTDWFERFHAATPKPKLLAQGTCAFAKGPEGQLVLELKKIAGGSRKFVTDATAKGLAKDSRFTVHDAQVRDDEADEAEDDERR
jgi:hypothetical protein